MVAGRFNRIAQVMNVSPSLRDVWATDPLRAGEVLYDQICSEDRPRWAAEILATCANCLTTVPKAVTHVISIGRSRWRFRWRNGHTAFSQVRRLTLQAEARRDEDTTHYLLYVAENAAKVIYNASDPVDAFDKDSGAWLVRCAYDFAARHGNERITDALWCAVSAHEPPRE